MTWLEALILGIIQGLTEFLPVSSSGHIQIAANLFGTSASDNLLFTVLVHAATVISTLIVFRKDITDLLKGLLLFKWNDETKLIAQLLVSMIPVGIVGLFFEHQVESFFEGKIVFVASMLIFTGMLLSATYAYQPKAGRGSINMGKAFVIGIAQAIAVLPGISRSGATIATGLLVGVSKENATRFSFLMVIVPILGASLLKLKEIIVIDVSITQLSPLSMVIGFVSAMVFGILACRWMIEIVKRGKLIYFAIYCFVVGISTIIVQWVMS